MFKIGTKIKLKAYTKYEDYEKHNNQVARIVDCCSRDNELPYCVRWDDGDESWVAGNNMILFQQEWDEEANEVDR